MVIIRSLLMLMSLVLGVSAQATSQLEVVAAVDAQEVNLGESFQLTVSVNENASGYQPDISPIRADFHILSSATRSNVRLVNNRVSAQTEWIYTLQPKKAGYLVIPPIQYRNLASKALTIKANEVSAGNQGNQSGDQLVFIESRVDKTSSYVQEQVIFTFRLYKRTHLIDPSITQFEPPDAVYERLGEQRQFQTTINGQLYEVIETRFAVFPQRSGALVLPGIELIATIAGGRGLFFDPIGGGRQIRRATDPITIEVKPKPASYPSGDWLPASKLTLNETWTPEQRTFQVGEPVTRTLTLEAAGLTPNALPPLSTPEGTSFRVYPEKPQTEARIGPDGLVGTLTQSFAFIPTEPGSIELPAIELHWWNTGTDSLEKITLPARSIRVLAGPTDTGLPVKPSPAPASSLSTEPDLPAEPPQAADSYFWQWLALGSVLIWLLTMLAWGIRVWQRNRRMKSPAQPSKPMLSVRQLRHQFQSACTQNQPQLAAKALIAWGNSISPSRIQHLGDLYHALQEPEQRTAITELETVLYRDPERTWDGAACWQALQKLEVNLAPAIEPVSPLHPLYPDLGR
jgi:hypothetical protein